MSWECPHQSGDDLTCDRLAQPCKPLSKGCVLYGKVQFIGQDQEATLKTSGSDMPKTERILIIGDSQLNVRVAPPRQPSTKE